MGRYNVQSIFDIETVSSYSSALANSSQVGARRYFNLKKKNLCEE